LNSKCTLKILIKYAAFEVAVSEWRIRSSFLFNLHRDEKDQNAQYRLDLKRNIGKTIGALNNDLVRFINPEFSQDRSNRHLRGLIDTAVELGILLLRQPARYEFVWTSGSETHETYESRHSSSQVVRERSRYVKGGEKEKTFPILVKVTDHYGKRLPRPQRIRTSQAPRKRYLRRSDTTGERGSDFVALS